MFKCEISRAHTHDHTYHSSHSHHIIITAYLHHTSTYAYSSIHLAFPSNCVCVNMCRCELCVYVSALVDEGAVEFCESGN